MNLLFAYVILNNRYSSKTKEPKYYPDIEGKVAEYCDNHPGGCKACDLYQSADCPRFTSRDLACYRGFVARLYFP